MATKKKSWQEKLNDSKDLPKVIKLNKKQTQKWGKGSMTMAIPSPLEVNAIMRKVPPGKLITINRIREKVAKKHHADIGCPITTGIFSWIAAHAAEEAELKGEKKVTPYWRTLKQGGTINEKYPGGIEKQAELLESEGHEVVQKGKNWMVKDWEKRLMK
jgi:alkylated DNA nucleotide flippase Atl1